MTPWLEGNPHDDPSDPARLLAAVTAGPEPPSGRDERPAGEKPGLPQQPRRKTAKPARKTAKPAQKAGDSDDSPNQQI